jgi:hypothetical protein
MLNLLEGVQLILPSSVELQPHLDAPENHLLTALEVNTKLYNIAIIDRIWPALSAGRAQADVVEKRARRTLNIFDVPFAALKPELAMPPAHDL